MNYELAKELKDAGFPQKCHYDAHKSPHFRRDSYWPNFVDK